MNIGSQDENLLKNSDEPGTSGKPSRESLIHHGPMGRKEPVAEETASGHGQSQYSTDNRSNQVNGAFNSSLLTGQGLLPK